MRAKRYRLAHQLRGRKAAKLITLPVLSVTNSTTLRRFADQLKLLVQFNKKLSKMTSTPQSTLHSPGNSLQCWLRLTSLLKLRTCPTLSNLSAKPVQPPPYPFPTMYTQLLLAGRREYQPTAPHTGWTSRWIKQPLVSTL